MSEPWRGLGVKRGIVQSARHLHPAKSRSHSVAAENFELRVQDVFTVIGQLAVQNVEFDLILADPPFGEKNIGRRSTSFSQRLLDDTRLPHLLAPQGLFVLGHTKRDTLSVPDYWHEAKIMKHGDSMMRFLKKR